VKIGIFTETYHPTVNGVVISVDLFRRELEKKGHEYFIFAPDHKMRHKREKHVYRLPSIQLPTKAVYPLALPMPYSMAKQHLPEKILKELDIIHIQHFSMMGQYGLAIAEEHGIPAVYTYHTMAELYTKIAPVVGELAKQSIRNTTLKTAAKSTHVITPSPSVKRYLEGLGVKKQISVIPTGIETKLYSPLNPHQVKLAWGIDKADQILLFVGRLATEKNIDFLVRAFLRVLKKNNAAHLMLVGDGPDKVRLQDYVAKNNLGHKITITGFLAREQTIELFNSADLFVFPSVTDTQGIVIIEAMAGGTVPVAVDRLGPHDMIKDGITGRLSPLNEAKFAAIILDLLANPSERKKMATAARAQAKHFDVSVTAAAMEKLYLSLTHEKVTRHPRS
jgi:glycosyltransferase involved in cell wall biosynthesis